MWVTEYYTLLYKLCGVYLSEVVSPVDLVVAEHVHLVEVVDLELVVRQVDARRGQHLLLRNLITQKKNIGKVLAKLWNLYHCNIISGIDFYQMQKWW